MPDQRKVYFYHCYTTITSAYHAAQHAALGLEHSDHVIVHLIPPCRQKSKLFKPVEWLSFYQVKMYQILYLSYSMHNNYSEAVIGFDILSLPCI